MLKMFRVFGYAIGYVFFSVVLNDLYFCTFSCEYCEIKHTGHSCLKQQSRRVPGRRREIQANEKVGCNVFFYVTDRGRSPVQSQHFLTLPKAAHTSHQWLRGARTRAHTHSLIHTRARALWVCELLLHELRISCIMLGAVKMEGHETPDWSSYYNDAQEVRSDYYFHSELLE